MTQRQLLSDILLSAWQEVAGPLETAQAKCLAQQITQSVVIDPASTEMMLC